MGRYVARRVLLLFPTFIGIITINFFIVQLAPGGPVDQMIATLTGQDAGATSRIAGADAGPAGEAAAESQLPGAQGLPPELVAMIEKQFGFDKPIHVRYFKMLGDYLTFDLGTSYHQKRNVIDLIVERYAGQKQEINFVWPNN